MSPKCLLCGSSCEYSGAFASEGCTNSKCKFHGVSKSMPNPMDIVSRLGPDRCIAAHHRDVQFGDPQVLHAYDKATWQKRIAGTWHVRDTSVVFPGVIVFPCSTFPDSTYIHGFSVGDGTTVVGFYKFPLYSNCTTEIVLEDLTIGF